MKARVRRFVEQRSVQDASDEAFQALALDLFRWQVERNATYGAMAAGIAPARVEDIPAVPVALFQSLPFTCFPPETAAVTFRTSGTTGSVRGVHRLRDTGLYDLGAWLHFAASARDASGALPPRVVSLCPTDADSSLGHMVAAFAERLGTEAPVALFREGGVVPDAWARLAEAAARGPIFLASTAFALDALFALPGAAKLDPASLVMVTGGFKGRQVRLDAPGLYAAVPERLGAPRVVGEYGMTELSSQLWTLPVPAGQLPGPFVAPPWLRVYPVDPESGDPIEGDGPRRGLLRFVDLCNVDSVLAIETMDVGLVDGARVTLEGRLAGAELRGCSLRAEDFLSATKRSGVS